MAKAHVYLNFSGNCREGMEFYKACLGGETKFMVMGDSKEMAGHIPAEHHDKIMHSTLTNGSLIIIGSDMNETMTPGFQKGHGITIYLDCDTEADVDTLFAKLSEGGEASYPPSQMFWGGYFGGLTDKFGFQWSLVYDKNVSW
ncbi:MAG: VOC family protein [Bacteroidota bacterium]